MYEVIPQQSNPMQQCGYPACVGSIARGEGGWETDRDGHLPSDTDKYGHEFGRGGSVPQPMR